MNNISVTGERSQNPWHTSPIPSLSHSTSSLSSSFPTSTQPVGYAKTSEQGIDWRPQITKDSVGSGTLSSSFPRIARPGAARTMSSSSASLSLGSSFRRGTSQPPHGSRIDDNEGDFAPNRIGVIGGARPGQASTLNPSRGGVTFPSSGMQTRSSSFSGVENRSPRNNAPLPAHLEESINYSAFHSSSPYPTFSEQSSPSSSPPLPNSAMLNHLSHSPPRAELNVSRSRSQSLATSGIRPSLGSGLIPMPMTSMLPSGPGGQFGRQVESPWNNSTSSGTDRLVMNPAAPDLSNSSPFARDIQSIINDETARARERVASRIQAETDAYDRGRFESTGVWPSRHAAAQQHLTSSIREAFSSIHDFGPIPFDETANGGVSGSSSRRHSVSVVGGPNARRGFAVAGFGFTDSASGTERESQGFSGSTSSIQRPAGNRRTGFSDDDLLAEGLETALNLHKDAERRGQAISKRTPSTELNSSQNSLPIATNGSSFRGRASHSTDIYGARDDHYSSRDQSLDTNGPVRATSVASRDDSRFSFGQGDRVRHGDSGSPHSREPLPNQSQTGFERGLGLAAAQSTTKATPNYMSQGRFGPPGASMTTPTNPYGSRLAFTGNAEFTSTPAPPRQAHYGFGDSSDRLNQGPPGSSSRSSQGFANGALRNSSGPNRGGGFSDPLVDQFIAPSFPNANAINRQSIMLNAPGAVSAPPFSPAPSFIGSIGSGPGPANERAYSELGKGIPLAMISPSTPLYIVEFKAGRTDLFYSHDPNLRIARGDLVVVEADRGQDLGKVTNDTITLEEVKAFQAQRQHELAQLTAGQGAMTKASGPLAGLEVGMGVMGGDADGGANPAVRTLAKEICPKRIFGKAGPADQQFLMAKLHDEAQALLLCQTKVKQKRLPMEVIDAEYQWDRRKLTFYFVAEKRIDFRELVKELFRMHKTRIWMASL